MYSNKNTRGLSLRRHETSSCEGLIGYYGILGLHGDNGKMEPTIIHVNRVCFQKILESHGLGFSI